MLQVALTDSDVKERAALQGTWPGIHLLLCQFHFKKAWRAKLKTKLAAGANPAAKARRAQLCKFLEALVERYVCVARKHTETAGGRSLARIYLLFPFLSQVYGG